MKESDTISVLVCVHSRDREHDVLLQRALESLVRQTYSHFQTVLVLDECWEDTHSIARSYADVLDMRIYDRPRKQGLANAKNFGLKHCTTDWVAYLDADDMWLDCKLEVQRNYMLQHPALDFCFTESWDLLNDVMVPNCFQVGQYRTHGQIAAAIEKENVLCHGSAMIKLAALQELGYYNENKLVLGREDWDLWRRAIASNNHHFGKVPERLYVYSLGTSVPR